MSTENRHNFKHLNCFSSWEVVNQVRQRMEPFGGLTSKRTTDMQILYFSLCLLFYFASLLFYFASLRHLYVWKVSSKISNGKILQVHIKKKKKINLFKAKWNICKMKTQWEGQNASIFIETKPKLQKHWWFNSQTRLYCIGQKTQLPMWV